MEGKPKLAQVVFDTDFLKFLSEDDKAKFVITEIFFVQNIQDLYQFYLYDKPLPFDHFVNLVASKIIPENTKPQNIKLQSPVVYLFGKFSEKQSTQEFILHIDRDSFFDYKEQLTSIPSSINANSRVDWSFLTQVSFYGNTIIIFDRYFVRNDFEVNFSNLSSLIGAFSQSVSDKDLYLTIISEVENNHQKTGLINAIKRIESNQAFNIAFDLINTNDLHDRGLIGNYFFIQSGRGFALYFNKKKKYIPETTTVDFFIKPSDFLRKLDATMRWLKDRVDINAIQNPFLKELLDYYNQ